MDNKEIVKILSLLNSSLSDAQRLTSYLVQTLMGAEGIQIPRSKIIMETRSAEEGESTGGSALDRMQEYEPGAKMLEDEEEEEEEEVEAPRKKRGRLVIDKKTLNQLYNIDGLSAKAIAERYGVSPATVNNKLREFGISKEGWKPRGFSKGKKEKKKGKKES